MHQFNILTTSESGRTDRLGDRKCRAEGNELYCDEENDARLAHAVERFIVWCHRAISEQVNDLSGNAVPREFIKAHVPAYEANLIVSTHPRNSHGEQRHVQQACKHACDMT
jgi:hypothetical protein